jgi:hypothetical protein
MLGNLRKGMVFRDDQPGIGFVIPEHDIEARPESLDEIGFQQQRLGLGRCGDHFQGSCSGRRPSWVYEVTRFLSDRALPT